MAHGARMSAERSSSKRPRWPRVGAQEDVLPHSLGAGVLEMTTQGRTGDLPRCSSSCPPVLLPQPLAPLTKPRQAGASRSQRTQQDQPPAHRSGGQTDLNVLELDPPPEPAGQHISWKRPAGHPGV